MGPSSGAGPRPLRSVLPFPEGLQPSPVTHFSLGTAKPASPCSQSREGVSPEPASHGRPSEEEGEPSWEEAGAWRLGQAPAPWPLSVCQHVPDGGPGLGGDCRGGLFLFYFCPSLSYVLLGPGVSHACGRSC